MNRNRIAIITPVKNESIFIKDTIDSVINQNLLPIEWIIVDDNSEDNTFEIINNKIKNYNWIKAIKFFGNESTRSGGSKVVRAFKYGYGQLKNEYDYVMKLDGDLILPSNYLERMIEEFNNFSNLGICGGQILNKFSETDFRLEKVSDFHVRGALKMFRKNCWDQIGGFKEVWNWDGLDVMEAQFKGWETRSINVPVIHLRPTTSAYDPVEHAYKSGYEAYKMGSNFTLTIIRSIFKIKKKPYLKCGYFYLKGYINAWNKKETLIVSKELAEFINKKHSQRIFKLN
ncbi:MAG: glycosyltransferase family 2 protein [Bacteroidetes bacterium]|jgi:glycosyltransferase involved in cell wall biosynthesis|nr:glycosyltransferase family 2 protein [Bacteroidota bacterium]